MKGKVAVEGEGEGGGGGDLCGKGAVVGAVAVEHPPHHRRATRSADEVGVLVALRRVVAGAADVREARVGTVHGPLRARPAERVGGALDEHLGWDGRWWEVG